MHYAERPLARSDLDAILEAGRWTGSAKNRQDWSFIVIQDREQLERVAGCGDFTDPIRNSAATVVIVAEPGGYEFDSGRVAQNMMLAAAAVGVASCPVTLHRQSDAEELLGVGEGRSLPVCGRPRLSGPGCGATQVRWPQAPGGTCAPGALLTRGVLARLRLGTVAKGQSAHRQ